MVKIYAFRVYYNLSSHMSIFKYSLLSAYSPINYWTNCIKFKYSV